MFQFGRFPSYTYWFSIWYMDLTPCGLLHSDICGSYRACQSPQLFAAYHVLLRLLMPRHPPCALISLTYSRIMSCFSTEELFEIVFYPLNFFNWISLISSLLFRYSIFKEHLSLSDIWSPWVLLVEMRRIELLTPCLQGRCSPSWATPPSFTGYFLLMPFSKIPSSQKRSSKLNNVSP